MGTELSGAPFGESRHLFDLPMETVEVEAEEQVFYQAEGEDGEATAEEVRPPPPPPPPAPMAL